jgi:predicted nucleic acid-binding protein
MSKIVVVDTSIVIKWVLNEPDSAIALALLSKWSSNGTAIHAPALLIYELTNALYQHMRKNDETLDEAKQALVDAFLIDLELDPSLDISLSMRAMEFAPEDRASQGDASALQHGSHPATSRSRLHDDVGYLSTRREPAQLSRRPDRESGSTKLNPPLPPTLS